MTFKYAIKPFFKVPKRMRKEPTLTIRDINKYVSNETKLKSRLVGIEQAYEGNTPKFLEGWTTYRFQTRNSENGHQYRLAIFSPTPRVRLNTKVVIDDQCPVYIFMYEYAMAKRGNAYIFRSNGDAPIRTNPSLRPGISHHAYRCLQYLVKFTDETGLKVSRKRSDRETEDLYREANKLASRRRK